MSQFKLSIFKTREFLNRILGINQSSFYNYNEDRDLNALLKELERLNPDFHFQLKKVCKNKLGIEILPKGVVSPIRQIDYKNGILANDLNKLICPQPFYVDSKMGITNNIYTKKGVSVIYPVRYTDFDTTIKVGY